MAERKYHTFMDLERAMKEQSNLPLLEHAMGYLHPEDAKMVNAYLQEEQRRKEESAARAAAEREMASHALSRRAVEASEAQAHAGTRQAEAAERALYVAILALMVAVGGAVTAVLAYIRPPVPPVPAQSAAPTLVSPTAAPSPRVPSSR